MICKQVIVLFVFAITATAATIKVPDDFKNIQDAISAAQKGDVVLVAAGTYHEPLKLIAGVTVKSSGDEEKGKLGLKRVEATILRGGVEMAEKSVLDGFTVTGVGIYDDKLWQHHFDKQGSEQEHGPIGAAGTPGIAVAVTCEVRNNIVHHIGYTGIAITGGSPRIIGNVCYRNMGSGIGSMEGSTAFIEKNLCFENFYAGIGISEGSSPQVLHNYCHDNIRAGIGLRDKAKARIENNRLLGNKLVAIGVTSGSEAVIHSNEITREGGTPPLIAVLEESKAVITGNTISGGGVAAIVVKGSADIARNHFVTPGPKKPILSLKGATVTESENMRLTDVAFQSNLDATEQRYVELVPSDATPTAGRDVVIALHGHGSDRWQFIREKRGECQGVRDVAAKRGLIVVSPDYRAKTSWMGPKAEADVVQIIAELKRRHQVGRVFIAGGSMGGTSALIFAALHPELIAGVCSLNGTANMIEYAHFQDAIIDSYGGAKDQVPDEYKKRSPELWPERFVMPVAVTTGGRDESVPPQSVLRLVEKLKEAKRKVLSIHREAGGHSTNYEDTCAAMEFMLGEAVSTRALHELAKTLKAKLAKLKPAHADLLADAEVFHKGAEWALRYESAFTAKEIATIEAALARGTERVTSLAANQSPWVAKKGKVVRGFVSAVDGSTQPYGVIIPKNYDGTKPMRLDVVLHGSSKPVGMSELKFISRFDEGDANTPGPDLDFIELHPFGRVENCYRWAGETDVFEAIEAVCRNYNIDRDRIVLRGMSMGASGTWHLGLKHPDRFVAIGPYCGYVDTHRFSETPIPNFIKVGPLPPHQERGLHMLDSVDYAANAGVVPAIAAIGDKDVFFQSHVIMGEAFAKEGIPFTNLISPGTGHVMDPKTHAEQMRRIGEHAAQGLNHGPKQLRFVTWTLKYNRCHWLEILSLGKHYERAEFRAKATDDGIDVMEARNITRFAIHRPVTRLRMAGIEIALPAHKGEDVLVFSKRGDSWQCDGPRSQITSTSKRPGLQGPIDDAFATPFLCVRGTGKPWNAEVNAWAATRLKRFEYEWARYMRGDLPVKSDTEVTQADVRDKHLILFGDPGSNSWIAKALPKLPVTWTREAVSLGEHEQTQSAKDHSPAFICASPLAKDRYIVINSGHTFHEKEFAAFNYLLFPRLGDWAMMNIRTEQSVNAGFFDESWKKADVVAP